MPLYARKFLLFIRHELILPKVPMEDRSHFPEKEMSCMAILIYVRQ